MEIHINAPGHPNQDNLRAFYESKLSKKYGKYDFVFSIEAFVKQNQLDDYEVRLILNTKKGPSLSASDTSFSENQALTGAIKKLNIQVEKFKTKHYLSSRRADKDSWMTSESE